MLLCCVLTADDTERLCQTLDLQQLQQLVETAGAEGMDAAARAAALQVWYRLHLMLQQLQCACQDHGMQVVNLAE